MIRAVLAEYDGNPLTELGWLVLLAVQLPLWVAIVS